ARPWGESPPTSPMTCCTTPRSLLDASAVTQRWARAATLGSSSRRAPRPTPTSRTALQNLKTAISRSTRSGGSEAGPATADLVRPQPSEGGARQDRVDQPVHRSFSRRHPGTTVPDRHLPQGERVADEGGDTGEAGHAPGGDAARQRAAGGVAGEAPDDHRVDEPLAELL